MKRALILCLLVLTGLSARSDTTVFPPLQPLNGGDFVSGNNLASADPFVKKTYVPALKANYPKINDVERSLFGKSYANQDILLRLARIEKSIFSTTYPDLSLAQRVDNIILNYNQMSQYPNISRAGLSQIEAKVFGRNYSQNPPQERIERLEQELLGAVQGGDLAQRYETLRTAAGNYNSVPTSGYYQNPLTTGQTGWKGLLGVLGSSLLGGGNLTGFTPSVDPYYSGLYGNGYNGFNDLGGINPGSGIYKGVRTNHGYSDSFRDYGSSSRVTILD